MLKWFKLFSSTLTRQLTDYLTLYKKAQTTFLCMNVAVQTLTCVCVSEVVSPFTAGSLSGNCQWLCCFESNLLLISIQTVLNKFSKLILKCNHFNFSLVESTHNWLKMSWKSKVKIDWKNLQDWGSWGGEETCGGGYAGLRNSYGELGCCVGVGGVGERNPAGGEW